MSQVLHRFPYGRWLFLIATAAAVLCPDVAARAQERQKQVLVLYSTRRDARIVTVGDRELPRILEHGLPEGLDYYSEFIDASRFPQPDYSAAFRDFLRLKYQGHRFDAVIAIGDISLDFVAESRNELFAGTPVVFFSSAPTPRRLSNATGVVAELNLTRTLDLALALQPDVKQVFVVTGANAVNQASESAARTQFAPFASRLSITYLTGLPTNQLEARLSALPPNSIVYYMVVDRDGSNENYEPLEYLERIADVANAPTYCWVDSAMDHGVVGGSLKSQEAEARAVGAIALRVLKGESADSIPVSPVDLNVGQVDWRQLQRWGISEARVPDGTQVMFREPSAWERYKAYILLAMALLTAQAILIAGLLVERSRRRRAEEGLLASQAKLRASYAQLSDLGGRLLLAQERERARIARELHDDVSQQMALLAIDLELLGGFGRADRRRDADQVAREALERVHGIARSVHDLSHSLHPAKLRLLGLVSALESLRRELAQPDIAISFTHENVPPVLAEDLTLCLFRVVQESLQNAVKHSGARQVSVSLIGGPDGLSLTIADDGRGFDTSEVFARGLGLISMNERLESIGGTLRIQSAPGAGTRLEASVPFRAGQFAETVAV